MQHNVNVRMGLVPSAANGGRGAHGFPGGTNRTMKRYGKQAAIIEALAKKDKTTLEDALRVRIEKDFLFKNKQKATSRVSYMLPIERLAVFRWAEFIETIVTAVQSEERAR